MFLTRICQWAAEESYGLCLAGKSANLFVSHTQFLLDLSADDSAIFVVIHLIFCLFLLNSAPSSGTLGLTQVCMDTAAQDSAVIIEPHISSSSISHGLEGPNCKEFLVLKLQTCSRDESLNWF